MDVAMVHWPGELARLDELRQTGSPRLLLVEADADPPHAIDCLEDWVRLPAGDSDVRARVVALTARSSAHGLLPEIDDDGLLRFRGEWAALSPVETELARALVERFGGVVGRDALAKRAWPIGLPTRNALDVHMLRLRRRITPLELEVRTVRGRGYLLQRARQSNGT